MSKRTLSFNTQERDGHKKPHHQTLCAHHLVNLTAGESVLDEAPTTKHKIRKRIVFGSRAEFTQKKGE